MKKIILLFLIINFTGFSQNQEQLLVTYNTKSLLNVEKLKEQYKEEPEQLKYALMIRENMEAITYSLKIDKNKSEFETIYKMSLDNQENLFLRSKKKIRYYVDNEEAIYQKEFQGEEILVIEPPKTIEWKLENKTKEILGFTCYKAIHTNENQGRPHKIEAWYAPELPYSFGPKGYHGLPGLILEIEQNNSFILTAVSVEKAKDLMIIKPTTGKKMTREAFTILVEETAKAMEPLMKN